jgi:putative aldouronate transport system permease protein
MFCFLFLVCFITLYPFWYVLVLSFNEGRDAALGGIWFWPRVFSVDNYKFVLNNPMLKRSYFITISRTVTGACWTLFVTGLAAYSMSKRHLPGRNLILTFFMIPMFIGGTVISTYIVIAKLGLLNTFLIYIINGFNFFFMIIVRTFIYGIPSSLEESAKIDGATYFTILFRIIFPLCMPVVAVILLFSGVDHWLDFYTNLIYVQKRELYTVQYLLYLVVRANQANVILEQAAVSGGDVSLLRAGKVTPQAIQMATLMVATLPILFVYPFLQKYFVKGVLIGAIKE